MFLRRSKKKSFKLNIFKKKEENVLENDVKPVVVESAVINETKNAEEEVKESYETDLIKSAVENEIEHSETKSKEKDEMNGTEIKTSEVKKVSFQTEKFLFHKVKILDDADDGFNIELIINDSHKELENCVSEEEKNVQKYDQGIDNEEDLGDVHQNTNLICHFSDDVTVSVKSDRYKIQLEERDVDHETTAMVQSVKNTRDHQNKIPLKYLQEKRDEVASDLQKDVLLKDVQEKRMATEMLQLQNVKKDLEEKRMVTEMLQLQNDNFARELQNEVLKKDLQEKQMLTEMLQLQNDQIARDLEKEVLKKDLQEKRMVTEMLQLQNVKITRDLQNEVLFKDLQGKRMATEMLQQDIDGKIIKLQKGIDKKEKEIKRLKLEIGTIDENLAVMKELEVFKRNAKELKESKKELSKKLKKFKKEELVDDCMISKLQGKCALVDMQLAEAKSACKVIKKKYDIDEENIKKDRKSLKQNKKDLESRVLTLENKNEGMRKQLEKELVSKTGVSRLLNTIKNIPASASVLEDNNDESIREGCEEDDEIELDYDTKKSIDSDTLKYHLAEFDKMSDELMIDVTKKSKNDGNRKQRKRSKKTKSSKSRSMA